VTVVQLQHFLHDWVDWACKVSKYIYTHALFNGHFPGQPGLAGCPWILSLILNILTGQSETLHRYSTTHCTLVTSISCQPKGF